MSTMQPPTALPRIDGLIATLASLIATIAPHDRELSGTSSWPPSAEQEAIRHVHRRLRDMYRLPDTSSVRTPYAATTAERCIATVAMVSPDDAAELAQMLIGLAVIERHVRVLLDMVDAVDDEEFVGTASTLLTAWSHHFGIEACGGFCSRQHDVSPSLRQLAALDAARKAMQAIADAGEDAPHDVVPYKIALGWLTSHGDTLSPQPSPVSIAAE